MNNNNNKLKELSENWGVPEELISELYFETKDNDIITGATLRSMMHIIWGDNVSKSNRSVIEFASECDWVVQEVDTPSIENLVKHGHTITAIKLYYNLHQGISLIDARNHINDIKKMLED